MKMKKVVLLFMVLMALAACQSKQATSPASEGNGGSNEQTSYTTAIDRYLVGLGKQYAAGEHCVPVRSIVAVDEQNKADIKVWGDFWVFNYNLVGDTLKCVSGGSHPGLMHISQTANGYEVTGFDQVEDGAGNLTSAQRIFGANYEAFHALNSNAEGREALRAKSLADYVKAHQLKATLYQDYGWPAQKLP